MRAMYPPEYFNGSGAPTHTRELALDLYDQELAKPENQDKEWVLIASQPRHLDQVERTICQNPGIVLWLHVDHDTLIMRAQERFKDDPSGLDLAMQRFRQDRLDQFDVIHEMARRNQMYVVDQIVMMKLINDADGDLDVVLDSIFCDLYE